jgi:hypothetical protein
LGELSQPMLPSSASVSSSAAAAAAAAGAGGRGSSSGGGAADVGSEFDLDDDALLTLISSLIAS